jgi:hypothetical protein
MVTALGPREPLLWPITPLNDAALASEVRLFMFTALGPHGWLLWFISASQRCCFRIGGMLPSVFTALGPHGR